MKKILIFSLIILFVSLFCADLQADRKSYDEVTGTNSAYNNYIQDVIGNKLDTTNGNSVMAKIKYSLFISSNSGTLAISNLNLGRTNANRNSIIQIDGITNYSLLLTNNNRLTIIQSDGVTNETLLHQVKLTNRSLLLTNGNRLSIIQSDVISNEILLQQIKLTNQSLLLTNNNRLSIIQSDGVTNESLMRTNINRLGLIGGTNYSLLLTNNNRLTLIQSDGITNESLLRTNRNWLSQIKISEISNYSLLLTNNNRLTIIQSDGVTNYSLLLTNNNRLSIIQSDGVTNEALIRTNMNRIDLVKIICETNEARIHMIEEHFHTEGLVYPTMAPGITVETKAAATWAVSNNYTNVVAAGGAITEAFDIHYISIEAISQNSVNELILYNMTTAVEIGRVRFTKTAAQEQVDNVFIMTPVQAANSKIGAQMGSSVAGTTATISIFYHVYD